MVAIKNITIHFQPETGYEIMSSFINLPSVMFLCRAKIILLLYLVALSPSVSYADKGKKIDSYRQIGVSCSWKNKTKVYNADSVDVNKHYYCDINKRYVLKEKENVRVKNPCTACKDKRGFQCLYFGFSVTQAEQTEQSDISYKVVSDSIIISNNSPDQKRTAVINRISCERVRKW